MSSRFAKNVNKAAVIDSWVNETQKQARTVNASLNRTTFTSGGFQGAELRSNINPLFVTRAFFHGELLIILNIRAKDQEELNDLLRVAGSFRALTKTERIIALIGEYTPDPLPLELPANLPPSDTTELHLHGMVKRVRESKEGKSPADRTFTHEINFDENGFVTSETSFVDGFPDVITAWGWVSGLRVNREISVAYPGGDGPRVGRRMVITGEVPFVLPDGNIYKSPNGLSVDVRYGTRFETKFDERRRPVQRKRFLNNGSLIFSQIFTYADGFREVKTSDVDGNFFSHFKYKLDEKGNVLEEQSLSDTGKILTATQFMYKYDASGNWIRKEAYQTQAFGSKPGRRLLGIYTRDLLYFDNSSNGPVA